MPKLIVQTNPVAGDRGEVTLSERVLAANLESPHYAAQLIERVTWATADAEAIESETQASQADHPSTGIPAGFALPAQVKKLEQRFDPPCSRLRAERERARPGIPLLVPGRATENPNRKRGRYE